MVVSSTGANFTEQQTINVTCISILCFTFSLLSAKFLKVFIFTSSKIFLKDLIFARKIKAHYNKCYPLFHISGASIGPSIVILSKQEYGLNEKVTMVCDSNSTYENLTCGRSIWKKDGQLKIIEYDNKMEFLMQRSAAGNYTCQCLNNCEKRDEFSDAIEIIFIETGKTETLCLLTYYTFYVIVQILVSITNHECKVAATKTILTRFDVIENSIFSLFPFFLLKPVSHLKLHTTYCYNLMIE